MSERGTHWQHKKGLGFAAVPALPQFIVLTDRDDGTQWVLSHSADRYRISLRTVDEALRANPAWQDAKFYEADQGPVLATEPRVQLLVRGGRLGYEIETLPKGVGSVSPRRFLTRRRQDHQVHEVIKPTETPWQLEDALAWVVVVEADE